MNSFVSASSIFTSRPPYCTDTQPHSHVTRDVVTWPAGASALPAFCLACHNHTAHIQSSLFIVKTVKSDILPPRYYRRRCSHPHGNPVRRDPVPAVLPSMWSPLPRFRAITAVFPPSPLPCRPLAQSLSVTWPDHVTSRCFCSPAFCLTCLSVPVTHSTTRFPEKRRPKNVPRITSRINLYSKCYLSSCHEQQCSLRDILPTVHSNWPANRSPVLS